MSRLVGRDESTPVTVRPLAESADALFSVGEMSTLPMPFCRSAKLAELCEVAHKCCHFMLSARATTGVGGDT